MASYSSARVGDVRRESRATIPGKEETKGFRILELERSIRKEIYTFGRSSTASFESVPGLRRCEAAIWRN